jgi:hypothetical protein
MELFRILLVIWSATIISFLMLLGMKVVGIMIKGLRDKLNATPLPGRF